jgi:hypothetical protein
MINVGWASCVALVYTACVCTQGFAFVITVVTVGGAMVTTVRMKPYVAHKVWKMPVKLLLLSITLLSALLNIVTFASEYTGRGRTGAVVLA